MDTKFFTWKPSDWGENHGSFTNFKNLLYQQLLEGQQPLTITLPVYCWKGQQPLLYNHFNGYNPYTPTM